jgi:hypothetical protein
VKSIAVLLALAAAVLAAPASAQRVEVSTNNALDNAAKKFVLIESKGQDARQQELCNGMLREQLRARGWNETDFKRADVAVFVTYRATAARETASSRPGSTGVMPVAYGQTAAAETAAAPGPKYERELRIEMFETKAFMRNMKMVPLYDATLRSWASAPDAAGALPELMKAAFEEFPGLPGKSQRTTGLAQ